MTTDRERIRERILFGVLVLLQVGVYAWLFLSRRMLKTHDTFYIYQVQYLFLAQACASPDPALWFPYSTHGVVSNLFANGQGSLFQNILLMLGGVPAGTSAVPLFYAGMFVDELVFLIGVWSLGRRFYSSPTTRFFVAAAALGSSFWASQIFFNHKFFYGIPLLLSLLHGAFDDGKRWNLLLAAVFAGLQFTGSTVYVPGFTLSVVLAYFGVHALHHRAAWTVRLRNLRPSALHVAAAAALGAILAALYLTLSEGTSGLRVFRPGRTPLGTVTLDSFLTFGTTLKPTRYLDLLLGISPSMDYTLYCGLATLACAALALVARPSRPSLEMATLGILVLLFSMGYLSLVGAVAYEGLPPLRYFRYVGMTGSVVKLFLILLAGHGFDALVTGRAFENGGFRRFSGGAAAIGAATALVAFLGAGSREWQGILSDFFRIGSADVANRPSVLGSFPSGIAAGTGLAAAGLAVLFLLTGRGGMSPLRFVGLLLILQTLDVYRWKIQMLAEETVPLDPGQYALHDVRPLPFVIRRQDSLSSERFRTFDPVFYEYGAQFDVADAFTHVDPPATRYPIGYWLAPFEALVQAQDRRPVDQRIQRPARLSGLSPSDPYAKIVGMTEDKVQIFRAAHVAGTDQALADFMNLPGFRGDVLLLSPRPGVATEELRPELGPANERIRTAVRILGFDANSASIGVTVPDGGWLSYSDVWDPGWTATVNGKPATVERSFLAYKAVRLEPGVNFIHFRYESPLRVWSHRLVFLASLFCVLGILFHGIRLFAPQK